jgi:hypothetical protein
MTKPTKTTVLLGSLELMETFTLFHGKIIYQVITAQVSRVFPKQGSRDVFNTSTKEALRMKSSQFVKKINL